MMMIVGKGITVPAEQLSDDALQGLVEEFVTRDGTDYGASEVPTSHKVDQVKGQLRRGEAVIVFDPETQLCDIVPRERAPRGDDAGDAG
jgi:uncharacterized protein YheU (UPF0270 family)